MKHPKLSHAFEVVAELPEKLLPLSALAYNFHWTWHHETRELFRSIDKERWEALEHNPIMLIGGLSPEKKAKLAADPAFLQRLSRCEADLKAYLAARTWFDEHHADLKGRMTVAYFCAEFGVSESLPIYSGGLGVLAGDHLKAASDLGLPLVGVGLLYSRGYFRQRLAQDGRQQEVYQQQDLYQMPLRIARGSDGHPVRIEVDMPDRKVTCQVWRADVGRIPLYLLDSNVLENVADDQGITDTLYGGGEEMRLRQEMVLGIGGMRALRALGITPTVCHMNEGHAAFLTLERIRQTREAHGCDFEVARQLVAASSAFTTHTPVPAGFDVFPADMMERFLSAELADAGLPFKEFLKLGQSHPDNASEPFNMALLAMRNANFVNGVSQLHATVTRAMFGHQWPGFAEQDVPIAGITNGIHTLTWVSKLFADLYDEFLGPRWRTHPAEPESWAGIDSIPDEELWAAIENQRGTLIRFVRRRLYRDLERRHLARTDFGSVDAVLDPRLLTVGFARRFATYKRATLMLSDRERLRKLLFHPERPIQIVFAGKSHPRDEGGKALIKELLHFIEHEGGRGRMVFLEDYDMRVARAMVQGVDVWLNNPRRPMEASGTSGMKVVPNAGINCSVLDGWWDEAYGPGNGFAIGERAELHDHGEQDWLDGQALYGVLESEVAPKFYSRMDNGLPTVWLNLVRQSIKDHAHRFNTARMVADYTAGAYVPAARSYVRLSEDGLHGAKEAIAFRKRVVSSWDQVRVERVEKMNGARHSVGEEFCVRAIVRLGGLRPEEVSVQAVVGRIGQNRDLIDGKPVDFRYVSEQQGAHVFETTIRCDEPGYRGYTVRVMPSHPDIAAAHELRLVRWEGEG